MGRNKGMAYRHVFPALLAKKAEAFCKIPFSSLSRFSSRRSRLSSSASAFWRTNATSESAAARYRYHVFSCVGVILKSAETLP